MSASAVAFFPMFMFGLFGSIIPLIFLGLTGWTLWFVMTTRPVEALFSLGLVASGLLAYWLFLRGSQAVR